MSVKKIESLNKHENPATNTNPFNIQTYLNDNWDKVTDTVDNNADELTTAKQDIADIKSKNTEQDTNISNINAKNTEQDSIIETNETKILELQSDNETNKTNIANLQSDNATNKSNIQSLQTDNTTNKQDILDIKQEQTTQNANIEQNKSDIANINEEIATINKKNTAQDTNIETLTQRLNEKDNQIAELEDKVSDLNNNQIRGKASGEYVHLSDSAKMNCEIAVLGNSRQETREGYNKLPYPYSESTATKNGITFTVNEDGTIKVNGTPTADTYFYLYTGKISDFKNIAELNGKKVKITQSPTGTNSTYYLSMYNFGNDSKSVYTQGRDSSYVTVDNQGQNVNIALCVKSGYVANNLVISPMILLEGETSTAYEQYGAMPSIEFESEIEAVGDNKNLFNKDDAVSIYSNGGAKSSIIDGGIRVTSANTNQATFCLYSLLDATNYKNKTFTVRAKNKTSASNKARIMLGLCDENGQNRITGPYANDSEKPVSYTIPNELTTSKFLGLWLYSNADGTAQAGDYVDYTEIKLVEGTEVGSYSSYDCGSTNVKVWNKNLFNKNNVTKLNAFIMNDGTNISVKSNGDTMIIVPINPNTTYTVSKGLQKTTSANRLSLGTLPDYPDYEKKLSVGLKTQNGITETSASITSKENDKYLVAHIYSQDAKTTLNEILETVQIEENTTPTDYIPHEEQNYPVDMQEQFRAIGDIRDCFVLKEDGKWYERHKVGEYIFTGNEDISNQVYSDVNVYSIHKSNIANINAEWKSTELKSNLFKAVTEISKKGELAVGANYINFYYDDNVDVNGFKTWLSEQYSKGIPLKIQYLLLTPIDIECTEQQTQQLQALQKAKTYKNITNITTDTIAVLDVDYKRDLETYQKQQDDRITAIEQLLSTTATSAMLLDNVQSDLESEVK